MIEHAFTRKNLALTLAYKDIASDISLEESQHRTIIASNAMKKIEDGTIFAQPLKKMLIAGKTAYGFDQLESELVSRLISKNIRANYRIRPENRHTIIDNTLNFLKEASPYNLYRFDIQNFFEEIDRKVIIKNLLKDGKCPRHAIVLLDKFFNRLNEQNIIGVPRGIGLSSTLAELVLFEFDDVLRKTQEVFYFSRFVDDILIITSPHLSAASLNSLVSETLLPLKVHKVGYKTATIHVAKMHSDNKNQADFDYLGYEFKIHGTPLKTDMVMGSPRRKIDVEISRTKILKIKNRLIDSFIGHIKSPGTIKDYELLTNRIKALTGNYYITDAISGIHRVGDGVTPVALSHHRTCGSAYGGSFNKLEALLSI